MARNTIRIGIFLLTIALAAVSAWYFSGNNNAFKEEAEKLASFTLGVKVDIGEAYISKSSQKLILKNIRISNPPGYKKPYAITAKEILVDFVEVPTNAVGLKKLERIHIKEPAAYFEANEETSNFNDLRKIVVARGEIRSTEAGITLVSVNNLVEFDASSATVMILDNDVPHIDIPQIAFKGLAINKGTDIGDLIIRLIEKYTKATENAVRETGLLNGLAGENE